jgi:hypothetical protein
VIRLRVSRRILRIIAGLVVAFVVVAGLYALGSAVTLRDADGSPLVLSPSLRAAERYRAQAQDWAAGLAEIDRRLTGLLAEDVTTDPTELYTQGQEIQEIGEMAASLAQETQVAEVPVALVGLREQAQAAANAYLEAALLAARWLSAPSEAGRTAALEVLLEARALRVELEESRWLQRPN